MKLDYRLSGLDSQFPGEPGQVHGAAFKKLMGQSFDAKRFVASGFARQNGQWKFNSASLETHVPGCWDGKRFMNSVEQQHVQTAVTQWINSGIQNHQT